VPGGGRGLSVASSKPAQTIREVVEGIPLSQKSLLLFTATITLVVTALVVTPWLGQWGVVDAAAFETLEQAARRAAGDPVPGPPLTARSLPGAEGAEPSDVPAGERRARVVRLGADRFASAERAGGFPAAAVAALRENPELDARREALNSSAGRVYRVALAERGGAGELLAVTLAESYAVRPQGRLLVLRVVTIALALLAAGVAAVVFYFITSKLVLSPVRELSSTAARVGAGDLSSRVAIETGDEFESFAEVFNEMLATLERQQDELRGVKESLDLQVAKLSEANVALHETAKLKGDFLATVSHELRTPLNSIIGFADLLLNIARKESPDQPGAPAVDPDRYEKRTRYLENILAAGRSLLDMINDLLEMARIEAGKAELDVGTMKVGAACEGLLAMIRPQAERKEIDLVYSPRDVDEQGLGVETDARKFQQIVFNFLANAVKFTPVGGRVELRVERLAASDAGAVRVSVIDTGPGIPEDSRDAIFEKFTQLDTGHERRQEGAGLGLAICKELAALIQGEIQLESAPGRGSMFSLIVPEKMDPEAAAEAALRLAGTPRAALAAGRSAESAAHPPGATRTTLAEEE